MSHVPHELHDEFPEYKELMHQLKMENEHFSKLADEYHKVNREIHRIETDVQPTSDAYQEDLRKKRMVLKDEIYALLKTEAQD